MLANILSDYRQNAGEEKFIQSLRTFAKYFGDKQEKDRSGNKQAVEETFGGIWIEDTEEFAKFAKAVNNSQFEEDGEGIAYTDNYFYAYYRNINGEPVPYASVYMNEAVSQDVVNQVNKELGDVRASERIKKYLDRGISRAWSDEAKNNANDGDNSSISNRRRNEVLGSDILRKGRYFDNPSLYVKTSRTDGRGDVIQTHTTANGEVIADVNEAQGQALFSLRTYREEGRDVLAEFLGTQVKDGALTEAEAQDMVQQMDDIYAFCETMKDHYAPFGQWSEAMVRISAR